MLIVTIHDVAPPHLPAVRALRDRAAAWGAGTVTLLVVPDHHGVAPLVRSPDTLAWLRGCAAAGDELALHGLRHREAGPIANRVDRLRARLGSAGEAEILVPDPDRAAALTQARAALTALVGAPVPGFVAPAWLEPRGFASLLSRVGFAWHETQLVLERLADRARVIAPVLGWATRTPWRERAALAWAAAMTPALARRRAPARIALHPGDLTSPAVMASIERSIRTLARDRPAVTTSAALATLAAQSRQHGY